MQVLKTVVTWMCILRIAAQCGHMVFRWSASTSSLNYSFEMLQLFLRHWWAHHYLALGFHARAFDWHPYECCLLDQSYIGLCTSGSSFVHVGQPDCPNANEPSAAPVWPAPRFCIMGPQATIAWPAFVCWVGLLKILSNLQAFTTWAWAACALHALCCPCNCSMLHATSLLQPF